MRVWCCNLYLHNIGELPWSVHYNDNNNIRVTLSISLRRVHRRAVYLLSDKTIKRSSVPKGSFSSPSPTISPFPRDHCVVLLRGVQSALTRDVRIVVYDYNNIEIRNVKPKPWIFWIFGESAFNSHPYCTTVYADASMNIHRRAYTVYSRTKHP